MKSKRHKGTDFNQNTDDSNFNFEKDFYGLDGYWTHQNGKSVRLAALLLIVIYYPYKMIIDLFIYLQKYDMFNCLVVIK